MSEELGRLSAGEKLDNLVQYDAPEKTVSAILSKMDEIIDAMKALTAKLDADSGDTGGDSDYAELISDGLKKIHLIL